MNMVMNGMLEYILRVTGNGCPYCGHQLASPDNNLTVHYPELISEWHPTKNDKSPEIISVKLKVWWHVQGMSGKHL